MINLKPQIKSQESLIPWLPETKTCVAAILSQLTHSGTPFSILNDTQNLLIIWKFKAKIPYFQNI